MSISKIVQFVNDLEECIQEQQNEVDKAILGLGSNMRVSVDKIEAVNSFQSTLHS